jgi:RNA polymerase sigma-70 factor (ECF subfamily)
MSGARLIASKAVRRFRLGSFQLRASKALSALHRRRDTRIDQVDMELIEDSADTPEKVVLNLDRSAQLRICLAQLSRDHREILDLVYYQQKSIEEIAEVIQIEAVPCAATQDAGAIARPSACSAVAPQSVAAFAAAG